MDAWRERTEEEWRERIAANLAVVRDRILAACGRAGRDPAEVIIVAVTKAFPAVVVRAAVAAGLTDIGENRVQEAGEKRAQLSDVAGVRWHLVGHLQRNKARQALSLFDVVHSVDTVELAVALERRAGALGRVLPVLLEVNVGQEESKFGFLPREEVLFSAAERMLGLSHLRLEGLMTVAPLVADPEDARPVFRRLRQLGAALRQRFPEAPWVHLSMGMTDDYVVAVEEAATMVRVGRALFGQRMA